ncbi:MAG: ABC transporter permease [Bacteroidetes bacterium]|nr:ABC transporter permease [Bacteroidota bacterium]
MGYSYFVAKRLLQSRSHNRFVSFLTFFATIGLAIGTMALLITVSILNGFQKQISENVSNFTANIEIRGFEQVPLPDYRATLSTIDSVKNVKSASPFISHEAMIRVHRSHYVNAPEIDGILLKGILPKYDNSSLRNEIKHGRYDLSNKGQMSPLLIGEKLAQRLEVHVGDTVFVFGIEGLPSPLNPPRVMSFVVTGIYETGMSEYDDLYGYTNMEAASYLFDMPAGNVSGFDVMVNDMKEIGATSDTLQSVLGYPYYPRTMFQMYRNLFAWIRLQKKPIPIIIALIIIVATFNIVGTLLMIVLEKMNAVGVLKTLGATRGAITRIFLAQGAFIGAIGTLLGSGLSYVLLEMQKKYNLIKIPGDVYFMNTVPVSIHVTDFILIGGIAFVLSLLASYLPARAAASLDPLESVRFY